MIYNIKLRCQLKSAGISVKGKIKTLVEASPKINSKPANSDKALSANLSSTLILTSTKPNKKEIGPISPEGTVIHYPR